MSLPISFISRALSISEKQVSSTINLFEENATVPFISRYRKEMTGGLDEVQVENIQIAFLKLKDLEKRKKTILETIFNQGNLSQELKQKIDNSWDTTRRGDRAPVLSTTIFVLYTNDLDNEIEKMHRLRSQ